MEFSFTTYDVFTQTRFAGNPLAIVSDADGLDSAQMQTIAREFNLSETVFILQPDNPIHTAKVRIFTPQKELPFAGHPTVGAVCFLAEHGGAGASPLGGSAGNVIITLEEGIGVVRAAVRVKPGHAPFAEFDLPRLPERIRDDLPSGRIAEALGLMPDAIGFGGHTPSVWSAGVPFTFVPVVNRDILRRCRLGSGVWAERVSNELPSSVTVYTPADGEGVDFEVRMFAPDDGIVEDPATGSSAAAFAGLLHHFERLNDGDHRLVLSQGVDMGRPSRIVLEMTISDMHVTRVRIGGHAVPVTSGQIMV